MNVAAARAALGVQHRLVGFVRVAPCARARPSTRSCENSSPSVLPTMNTLAVAVGSGVTVDAFTRANVGTSTRRDPLHAGQASDLAFERRRGVAPSALNDETVRSDGSVLARNFGYDDWVRRAPATDANAIPPVSPIRSTIATYPPIRRPNVARNRYHATRQVRLTALCRPRFRNAFPYLPPSTTPHRRTVRVWSRR